MSIKRELDWHLLEWARELRTIAKIAFNMHNLNPTESVYDSERYSRVEEVANKIATMIGRFNSGNKPASSEPFIFPDFKESGYITPKVAVAVAAFNQQNKLLLVKRSDTQSWVLPGGWAEIGRTPLGNAVDELRQKTGVLARCDNLIAVYNERFNKVGRSPDHIYTLLFHCTVLKVEEKDQPFSLHRHEVLDAGFFSINDLTRLDLQDGAATQVVHAFEFHVQPGPAFIDQKA